MLKYKPLLKVFNGCVPFPAVDADGNTRYARSTKQLGRFVSRISS